MGEDGVTETCRNSVWDFLCIPGYPNQVSG